MVLGVSLKSHTDLIFAASFSEKRQADSTDTFLFEWSVDQSSAQKKERLSYAVERLTLQAQQKERELRKSMAAQ